MSHVFIVMIQSPATNSIARELIAPAQSKCRVLAKTRWGGFCIQLMSDHPARRGPGSVLDQVPLPVDVSAGLSFTGRDPAPRKWSPLTGAELGRQHSANHIYLFIRTTLERLIVFSFWTQPFANESLIGTDRAQNHERVINKKERRETRETILETQVDIRQYE